MTAEGGAMSTHQHRGFVPDPSWPSILELAIKLWGQPTDWSHNRDEARFGSKGSKSIRLSDQTWFDHEAGEGGGYADLHLKAIGPLPRRPEPTNGGGGKVPLWENVGTVYHYHDADGALILDVVRTRNGQPRFLQRAPDPGSRSGWKWSVKHILGHDCLLYRLPGLRASGDAMVWITEGEKDADRLHDAGLIATTNIGGAGKWRDEYVKEFRGKHCVVLQDNDQAGRDHTAKVARSLIGTAASVKALLLPGLPEKADVSDWLDAANTIDELQRLAREAPEENLDAPPPGRILSGADFIARHVPPVWLIDGIVQRGRLYACTSLTGHGKTAVWLFNACMIHAGRMIGQLAVFQGNVLFLAGENPADLEARMIGMAKTYNLPAASLPYVLPGSFPLTEAETDALKRDIAGLGVPLALIVGDTASSFFPGDDENSNVQAGGYARTLRTFTEECDGDPAVVVLSHPVKGAGRGNLLPRGGGAFLNELDGNLANWSDAPGEVTELHWCGKIRGPDFSPFGYRLRTVPTGLIDEKDRSEMTIVAEPMSEEAVADHSKQTLANDDVVLRALRDHPDWSFARIAREAGWLDEDNQPMKRQVQSAIRRLAEDKLVAQLRKGAPWTLTTKGEEALHEDSQ
jgi:hypothetical protein